jgi:hypothetical protein
VVQLYTSRMLSSLVRSRLTVDLGGIKSFLAIRDSGQAAVNLLQSVSTVLSTDNLTSIDETIKGALNYTEPFKVDLNSVDLASWSVTFAVIPFNLIGIFMMTAVVIAMFDFQVPLLSMLYNWFLCPLFILMNCLCWVVAASMLIAAGVNGDFCLPGGRLAISNSPDSTIRIVLLQLGFNETTSPTAVSIYATLNYYINQCAGGVVNPFQLLRDALTTLVRT